MMERRAATDQPVIIYLITSRGYMASQPIEWQGSSRVECKFHIPVGLYVNGFFVTHPDGAVLYQSQSEFVQCEAGETYSVGVNLAEDDEPCDDPHCTACQSRNYGG